MKEMGNEITIESTWSPTVVTTRSNGSVHQQFLKRDVTHFPHSFPSIMNVTLRWATWSPLKGHFLFPFYSYGAVASPSLNEVVFQYVQAAHHLGKDKHPVATSLQFWQQLVNQHELASSLDHRLELEIWRVCIVCFFKLFQNFLFSTCRDWTA